MSGRAARLGDRVTIGKGRTRYTVVAVITYGCALVESVWAPSHGAMPSLKRAVLARDRRSYWRGKRRGSGKTVDIERLRVVRGKRVAR